MTKENHVTFDPNRPSTPESFTPAPVAAATPTPPAARKSGSGGRALNLLLGLAAVVAIGGVAFAAGRNTAPVSAATGGNLGGAGGAPRGSGAPGLGGRGGAGGLGGGLTISGTVQSVTGDTLTVTTAAGQTITVTTGTTTTYNTQSPATAADVQAGKKVQVQLDGGGGGRPTASAAPSGPVGTAGSVTVIP
jgi:hypothetical protein